MRLLVFYDLPMANKNMIREYSKFRNFLLKEGYVMMQYSVYSKLCLNQDVINHAIKRLSKNLPQLGNVRSLQVTENQYQKIQLMVGNKSHDEVLQSDKRLVII